jgi:hypothetical protein
MARIAIGMVSGISKDEFLRFHDSAIDAAFAKFSPIRRAQATIPSATRADIHLEGKRYEAF